METFTDYASSIHYVIKEINLQNYAENCLTLQAAE